MSAFYFARMTSDLPVDCTLPTVFIILVRPLTLLQAEAPCGTQLSPCSRASCNN